MYNIPTSRAALLASGATCIAEVSSEFDIPAGAKDMWTVLSLWWIDDEDRPFIAVAEGKVGKNAPIGMVNRFRSASFGTMNRAFGWFDETNLRDDLLDAIPADASTIYPNANVIRSRRAAARREERGYEGEATIAGVALWLYGQGISSTAMARMLEEHFGIPFRTAFNGITGSPSTGWAKAFIASMRYFDRKRFHHDHGIALAQEGGADGLVQ